MSLLPTEGPRDLVEALAVSPFYHLIPNREITPLLSYFSTDHPAPQVHVPSNQRLRGLLDRAIEAVNEDPDAYKDAIDALMKSFGKIDDVKLENVRFKKPVIASEGLGQPGVPTLPPLYAQVLDSVPDVSNDSLVEQTADLKGPQLSHIDGAASAKNYDLLIAEEIERQFSGQKRNINVSSVKSRKRIHLDPEQLTDSTLAGIVDLIDKVGLDDADEVLDAQVCTVEDNKRILSLEATRQLLHHYTRLAESHRIPELHLDYIRRTQQLCLNLIKDTELATLRSLQATRLLLIIITTSGLEKRLYTETYISSVVDYVSSVLVELTTTDENAFDEKASFMTKLFQDLTKYVSTATTDERILTKIEYSCLDVIFGESKESTDVCFSLIQLLVAIFRTYDHQRQFLVHEILNNFSRIERLGQSTQLSTSQGITVSSFTISLVKFIQSIDLEYPHTEINEYTKLPKSSNPTAQVNKKRQLILDNLAGKFTEVKHFAHMIASFCTEKLISSETKYKTALNILLDDLLNLLASPEFPGAETILVSLTTQMIENLTSGSIQSSNEPLALDIIGRVGIHILKLKKEIGFVSSGSFGPLEIPQLADLTIQSMQLVAANKDYIKWRTLSSLAAISSRESSGTSRHGFFHSSPDKKPRVSDTESAVHEAVDLLFSQTTPSTSKGELASYEKLNLLHSLDACYDEFLSLLTRTLESSKVRLSTKAIRVLSSLVNLDLDIFKIPKITVSISRLLESNAALSRDAIIELLAKFISSNTDLLERYYKPICARTGDESVAVRKRVIRIMKEFLDLTSNVDIKSHFCIRLMRNLEDVEENMRELAQETLYRIWFHPSLTTSRKDVILMMIQVITHTYQTQRLFEQFIFSDVKEGKLLVKQDQLAPLAETTLAIATDLIDTKEQKTAENSLKLLSIFAKIDMDIVTQDSLVSLLPYLSMADSSEDVCFYSLKIIRSVSARSSAFGEGFIRDLQDILLKRLTKFNVRELHQAVPILNDLCERSNSQNRLFNAIASCIKLLASRIGKPDELDQKSLVVKLLQLFGCFGAFCDLEGSRDLIEKANVGLKGDETVTSLLMRFILHFLKEDQGISTRSAAMKSLLLICTYHPKMFLLRPVMRLLNAEFENGSYRMKLTILEGFNSFLLKEDDDAGKRSLDETHSSEKRLDVEVFHGTSHNYINDSVCLSLIQSFITPALELCLQDASPLSLTPVKFLELIMKLGFANPKVCAPTIIALEASPNKFVRKIAFGLHKQIFEKHESLADRNYVEAFKLAVDYNKKVGGDKIWENVLFLRSVYKVVSRSYSSRKRLILSLVRLFTIDTSVSDLQASINTRDTVLFLVLNLSVLPFLSLEEVCLVLYHLDRSITHVGIELADRVFSTVGSNSGEGMSVDNLQLLFVHSQCYLALIYLRQTLSAAFAVSNNVMENFLPNRVDVELRQQPKAVTLIDFPLENLELDVNISHPSTFGPLFTRFFTSVKDFTL